MQRAEMEPRRASRSFRPPRTERLTLDQLRAAWQRLDAAASTLPRGAAKQVAGIRALGGPIGVRATTAHLDHEGLHYELISHKPTFRAADDAIASGVPRYHELKTLLLRGAEGFLLAGLRASDRINLRKVRDLVDDRTIRLASEAEMARAFPTFDVGALPPLGPGLPQLRVLDSQVPKYSRVVCAGGDHTHSLLMIPVEIINAAHPRVANITED